MKDKIKIYFSIYCLVSLILAPFFFYICFFNSKWSNYCYSGFEIIPTTFYFGFIIFPILFIYQLIKKQKGLALKLSIISLFLFVIELAILTFYLYLLSRAVHD